MQSIIKEVKEIHSKDGTKTFYEVTFQDDAEATTFDATIKQASSGDSLEWEADIKGKYVNIKDGWKLTKQTSPIKPENGSQMSKEEWAEKQNKELMARAKNTALMQACELAKTDRIKLEEITLYADRFLAWLKGSPQLPQAKTKPVKDETSALEEFFGEREPVKPTEKLFSKVAEAMGWRDSKTARTWIVNVCKIADSRITSEPDKVWEEICQLQGWTKEE